MGLTLWYAQTMWRWREERQERPSFIIIKYMRWGTNFFWCEVWLRKELVRQITTYTEYILADLHATHISYLSIFFPRSFCEHTILPSDGKKTPKINKCVASKCMIYIVVFFHSLCAVLRFSHSLCLSRYCAHTISSHSFNLKEHISFTWFLTLHFHLFSVWFSLCCLFLFVCSLSLVIVFPY